MGILLETDDCSVAILFVAADSDALFESPSPPEALVGGGGYAEKAVAYEGHCMKLPESLRYNQGACIYVTYISTLREPASASRATG